MSKKQNQQSAINEQQSKYGFSLKSVCWGYRDIFAKSIQSLLDENLLGDERPEVTEKFFELLKCSEKVGFDHVVKEFLCALNPNTRWIMDIPSIFIDVVDLGAEFARLKNYYGTVYFKTLGEGGFGESPQQVRNLVNYLRRLREIDEELAIAFLKGYSHIIKRLAPSEIDIYINEGIKIFNSNKDSVIGFMEGKLKSSENIINTLTRECRLQDIQTSLESLLKALVGYEIEISDLGKLDSDELFDRGTRVVCMYKWLYLPIRIRYFDSFTKNKNWYMLIGVIAAGMLSQNSFCRIHGHPEYTTCEDLVGQKELHLNLFQIIEYTRVLKKIKEQWPGASKLIDFGIETEFSNNPPQNPSEQLFYDLLMNNNVSNSATKALNCLIDRTLNAFDTASKLKGEWTEQVLEEYPGLESYPLRSFSFLPDFFYPGEVDAPPMESLIVDLKQKAQNNNSAESHGDSDDEKNKFVTAQSNANSDNKDENEEELKESSDLSACFVYDEWSQPDNDYYRDYCFLREIKPANSLKHQIPLEISNQARKIRKVFELLKPDIAKFEKYLPDGDLINHELLLRYLIQRKNEPSPKIDFYEKTLITQRDLAVLILLDVSGSTGEKAVQNKVIEIEKEAAIILGEGLNTLDDRFAICGFSGNGRKNCEYYIYKSFKDDWNKDSRGRILSASPLSSTRIGVALRHSGYLLSKVEAKQRIIILITDGKPMDTNYDANTRYAQYDVRMACEENKHQGIYTFCISTEENSRADMEIMFPNQRFVILTDLRQLPNVLPKFYVNITT